jgi:hypothetical protein
VQVGDLVKIQAEFPHCFGLVVEVEKEFYMHQGPLPEDFQDRITVVWQNGDESFEPQSILEVVNESR